MKRTALQRGFGNHPILGLLLLAFNIAGASVIAHLFWQQQNFPGGGGGISSPGVFNSNFDPPLFQNYTLTTTGAQTGINLTANPIDTHTITWRMSPGPAAPTIDLVPYANGDLHTANANWVYDAGTFQVSTNVIYGSAAGNSMTHRSDGPLATANEYAQTAVVETAGQATQNHGPCVRIQTGAVSGYCLLIANNLFQLTLLQAGAGTNLQSYTSSQPVTGDTVQIQAIGNQFFVYKNSICLSPCGVTDSTFASGSTGLYNAGNSTSNGVSSFQSGVIFTCGIQLDSSPDGSTWTAGGAIPSQNCGNLTANSLSIAGAVQSTSSSFTGTATTNNVRVNVTALPAGQTLTVVYSGRLAPAAQAGSSGAVTNAQYIQAGQVLWAQYTIPNPGFGGGPTVQQSFTVITSNGQSQTTSWSVASCAFVPGGGVGTGFVSPVSGWVQYANAILGTGSPQFPNNSVLVNLLILNAMPTGGGQSSCVGTLQGKQYLASLGSWLTGSFLPVSFVGTTPTFVHPWSVPGYTFPLAVTSPAAGAEWSLTIPANGNGLNARTCIQNVSFTLASGSTGVTPVLVLTFNGSKLVYAAATQQGSTTTQTYSFSPGAVVETVTAGSTLYHIVPFNNGQLACYNSGLTTATIGTLTTGINGTSQYSAISILTQIQNDNN